MDINKCPNCQNQYDQDRRISKQLPCGCVSCLQCYKTVFQLIKRIECVQHQQVYNQNPEELEDYVIQNQVPQQITQPQLKFIDQKQVAEQFKWLQDQYVSKQNHYREIMKVVQDSSYFMKHIQSLASQEILKSLIDQFCISNNKIKNCLKRLSDFQVVNEVQQQQALVLGQQDPLISQNSQGELQQQFQQILHEIEELKKDQWMDVQNLRVTVQRCMFGLFIYLSESSKDQLLEARETEYLVQKYLKQVKVQNNRIQVSNSLVHQKNSFLSQSNDSQESQRIEQQQQNQVIDKQKGQDSVQVKQLLIQKEISPQEKQVVDTRLMAQQMEQKSINIQKDIRFNNQMNQLFQEQAILLKNVPDPHVDITFDKLVQLLNQIKEENVSIQSLNNSILDNSDLIEYPQILLQLPQVTDQQICLKLIQILNLSKNQPQIQQEAANVITMLNYMNYDFTNQDFSNLDLKKSDLSDTSFTSCNFSNSNLTQSNLRNTKFINCDLSNSNLTSIVTEHPHIFTGHKDRVTSVYISSDSEFIVSGSGDSTIIL